MPLPIVMSFVLFITIERIDQITNLSEFIISVFFKLWCWCIDLVINDLILKLSLTVNMASRFQSQWCHKRVKSKLPNMVEIMLIVTPKSMSIWWRQGHQMHKIIIIRARLTICLMSNVVITESVVNTAGDYTVCGPRHP